MNFDRLAGGRRCRISARGLVVALGLAGLSLCAAGTEERWAPPPEREQFHVFLLLGQSNMSGLHIVHFVRASLIEFGKRYAAALAALEKPVK